MPQRVLWLLFAFMFPVVILLQWTTTFSNPSVTLHNPQDVIISEVAWGGTTAGSADEWIELYNNTAVPITLTNWTLTANDGVPSIILNGTIPASGFFLLERTDDNSVSDIPADQFFTGDLNNTSDGLTLRDDGGQVIDSANADGGAWPAGSGSPDYTSMERISHTAVPGDSSWADNDGITVNGLDADGNPLQGTPKANNSTWGAEGVDLVTSKQGPLTAVANTPITYQISLRNNGNLTATAVTLTDTLPGWLTYLSDDSGLLITHTPPLLIWQAGDLPGGATLTFTLSAQIAPSVTGVITNQLLASTISIETNTANNVATAVTQIDSGIPPNVLIDAAYYDGIEDTGDQDEAIALRNVGQTPVNLGNWRLSNGTSTAVIPANTILPPGTIIWLAKNTNAFTHTFGFLPDVTMPSWPGFSNDGDEVILSNDASLIQDVLVYEDGNTAHAGWSGTAVIPYTAGGLFGAKGQILYRRLEPLTGLPVPDTNTAADWASWTGDVWNGRKVRYPGWNLEQFFFTQQITETGTITIAIAPDNAYDAVIAALDAATQTIHIESHTFENLGIADALVRATDRSVSVTVLLEGDPPGGLTDQEKYICAQIAAANGACWFMINDDPADIADRYRYLHAKFVLIDGRQVIISSENLSPNSLPYDDKSDGTWGRRGVVFITDAPGVVQHVTAIFAADFDPTNHADLLQWNAGSPDYGPPSPGFVPITVTGGITYPVYFPETAVFNGSFSFEIVQSPENSLRNVDSLLGLVNRVGEGDTLLVEQLEERSYWGPSTSNPTDDPNPRLEAYIDAARRGATVRILLDEFFDDNSATSNDATCHYVQEIAQQEHLHLTCARHNPTGLGIHNKMVLAQINGQGYIHIGSINGTEQASKGNRELAVQVQSDEAYVLLAAMFERDWPHRLYMPLLYKDYIGPATYPLIGEILYDPPGLDDAEFIELVNPTYYAIDLGGYGLGDAVNRADFEDVRRFPAGTFILAQQTLVIATTASAFWDEYGFYPDFEILETVTAVPNLIDDPTWGDPATFLQLGNQGDEVILRNTLDQTIDVVTYGTGTYPGVTSCPLVPTSNNSLERYPYWRDTNDCSYDFRIWPFPNPGTLP
ncbi:MAG: lamin tail domain-containing protein [Ardenticatenaceae bacterium]|nr:lamin tail domain-containing protein [Anaerolineales bacterium]MCB8922304.1 lamin tail domain-containing protein [Ardenticatenaceae bacterium]MCB8990512.1 lamin tail domain-containing protein [Ardenticatenaceae bacterium]